MVFFTSAQISASPSLNHFIPLTSLDLSLSLISTYIRHMILELWLISLSIIFSPICLSLAVRDRLVWQECHTRRGSSRHGDHTPSSIRSVDKWIIGP